MRISEDVRRDITRYFDAVEADEAAAQAQLAGTHAVARLEERLCTLYGMRHALCVSSASTGLLGVALALNLGGEEFITTPYTYGATVAGWMLLGARPVFADVDPETLTLDPEAVGNAVTENTKAILAVDIFGNPCDSQALRMIAERHGIWYVADAAQSFGGRRDGVAASRHAHAIVLSFTAGKALFAGEGGAILTDDDDLYERLVWHTQHPLRQRRDVRLSLDNELAPVNGRIHPLAAVWANATFDEALRAVSQRRSRYMRVVDLLNDIGMTGPVRFQEEGIESSFFRLTAAWNVDNGQTEVSEMIEELRRRGVNARVEEPPAGLVYRLAAFRAQFPQSVPNTPPPVAERQASHRIAIRTRDVPSKHTGDDHAPVSCEAVGDD
jgi:perosamine synthetase